MRERLVPITVRWRRKGDISRRGVNGRRGRLREVGRDGGREVGRDGGRLVVVRITDCGCGSFNCRSWRHTKFTTLFVVPVLVAPLALRATSYSSYSSSSRATAAAVAAATAAPRLGRLARPPCKAIGTPAPSPAVSPENFPAASSVSTSESTSRRRFGGRLLATPRLPPPSSSASPRAPKSAASVSVPVGGCSSRNNHLSRGAPGLGAFIAAVKARYDASTAARSTATKRCGGGG
eukprot:CAMPEP_0182570422 /NCGR_PEP_ID=MMETSP1324-20130603/10748_1 /TAXON_ID=236786 /ORGANISM="Florenciella sp., Strain RCC1587" /LENGTH=234 /DNA_ID=CAMNT_0024784819 /DNA_START=1070 /DNA_END=1772 /DNA_ORIENTATION=-